MPAKNKRPKINRKRTKKQPASRASSPVRVELKGERVGKRIKVTGLADGQAVHVDTIDVNVAPQRGRFIKAMSKLVPNVDFLAIEKDLLKLPHSLQPDSEPESPPAAKVVLAYTPRFNGSSQGQ